MEKPQEVGSRIYKLFNYLTDDPQVANNKEFALLDFLMRLMAKEGDCGEDCVIFVSKAFQRSDGTVWQVRYTFSKVNPGNNKYDVAPKIGEMMSAVRWALESIWDTPLPIKIDGETEYV